VRALLAALQGRAVGWRGPLRTEPAS
jgi:hypothetical protein